MTDWSRKTRNVGPPIKDKRKVVPEPPKHPPAHKPKVYVLTKIITTTDTWVEVVKFPTKAAMEQHKLDYEKKLRDRDQHLYMPWRRSKDPRNKRERKVEYEVQEDV